MLFESLEKNSLKWKTISSASNIESKAMNDAYNSEVERIIKVNVI